jgi:hypothetical protein
VSGLKFMTVRDFKETVKISAKAFKRCFLSAHTNCKHLIPADSMKYDETD